MSETIVAANTQELDARIRQLDRVIEADKLAESDTVEEQAPKLLDDLIRANPDAFDFSAIQIPGELGSTAGAAAGKKAASIEDLLGLHAPVEGHPELLMRRPKLRQRLQMVGVFETRIQAAANTEEVGVAYAEALAPCFAILDKQTGRMRPATGDDLLDTLDDEQELLSLAEALGLKKTQSEAEVGDPNV